MDHKAAESLDDDDDDDEDEELGDTEDENCDNDNEIMKR